MTKSIAINQLERRFGQPFVEALRQTIRLTDSNTRELTPWQVGKAKNHFSEVLDRISNGEGQLVRRRTEDPVMMLTVEQLAAFVELAAPKRRFAEVIAHNSALPVGAPPLSISDTGRSRDHVKL